MAYSSITEQWLNNHPHEGLRLIEKANRNRMTNEDFEKLVQDQIRQEGSENHFEI